MERTGGSAINAAQRAGAKSRTFVKKKRAHAGAAPSKSLLLFLDDIFSSTLTWALERHENPIWREYIYIYCIYIIHLGALAVQNAPRPTGVPGATNRPS
jgi:hypothetical protein